MSEGVENCIKGLSVKVCWFQYFSCRNSHRFMMCTMTAEKSDCNSLLDSLSLDDPLVTKNRVGGFFSGFLLFCGRTSLQILNMLGASRVLSLFSQNCRVLIQIIISWQTPFSSDLLEGREMAFYIYLFINKQTNPCNSPKPRFRKPLFGRLTWPCILFTSACTIFFLHNLLFPPSTFVSRVCNDCSELLSYRALIVDMCSGLCGICECQQRSDFFRLYWSVRSPANIK